MAILSVLHVLDGVSASWEGISNLSTRCEFFTVATKVKIIRFSFSNSPVMCSIAAFFRRLLISQLELVRPSLLFSYYHIELDLMDSSFCVLSLVLELDDSLLIFLSLVFKLSGTIFRLFDFLLSRLSSIICLLSVMFSIILYFLSLFSQVLHLLLQPRVVSIVVLLIRVCSCNFLVVLLMQVSDSSRFMITVFLWRETISWVKLKRPWFFTRWGVYFFFTWSRLLRCFLGRLLRVWTTTFRWGCVTRRFSTRWVLSSR